MKREQEVNKGHVWRNCRALGLAVKFGAKEHCAFSVIIKCANEEVWAFALLPLDLFLDLGKKLRPKT